MVHENPWWTYRQDEFEIPGGVSGQYHYVHTAGSSMVVPVADDGRIVLVNQWRYLGGAESVEFPCGSCQGGRDHLETAKLELAEETGYEAGRIDEVGRFNPYNGVTDEMCRVFVATGLRPVSAKCDATEEFEVIFRGIEEIEKMVGAGEIWDGMTLSAWILAREAVLGLSK